MNTLVSAATGFGRIAAFRRTRLKASASAVASQPFAGVFLENEPRLASVFDLESVRLLLLPVESWLKVDGEVLRTSGVGAIDCCIVIHAYPWLDTGTFMTQTWGQPGLGNLLFKG
jgi:hypothetical protein